MTTEILNQVLNLEKNSNTQDKISPRSLVHSEKQLVEKQLERLQGLHEHQLVQLVRAECYVDSDLLKLDSYYPRQFHAMFEIRDNLKTKLLQIDKERRQLTQHHEHEVRKLEDRLFQLHSQGQVSKNAGS